MMKKFILNIFIFTLFTSLFYTSILFVWGFIMPSKLKPNVNYNLGNKGYTFSRLQDVKKNNNIDILFLGSSHTYRGFDTRIFLKNGYKTFNLGTSAQTPIQTKLLLNRYLDSLKPKTVLYEVYPVTFELDGVESSFDIISNDKNDFYSLEMVLELNNIRSYNTFLYSFICDILGLNKSFKEPVIDEDDKYTSGGYVEKDISFFKVTSFEKQEITINKDQLDSFNQIVEILKQKKIELILVYAPITKSKYNSYNNNNYFDSLMTKYSTYYNFNKIVTLNDSLHFYDSHHLNQNGVEIFNKRLIKILNEK